jgi:hypothetical protein
MHRLARIAGVGALIVACLSLSGCSGNVGVGINVGVPVGSHGYISMGTSRWY